MSRADTYLKKLITLQKRKKKADEELVKLQKKRANAIANLALKYGLDNLPNEILKKEFSEIAQRHLSENE